jgi:hypothetical protein
MKEEPKVHSMSRLIVRFVTIDDLTHSELHVESNEIAYDYTCFVSASELIEGSGALCPRLHLAPSSSQMEQQYQVHQPQGTGTTRLNFYLDSKMNFLFQLSKTCNG